MKTNKTYNGFDNWNTWNVVLWINNDESLYREAFDLVQRYGITRAAAKLWRVYKGARTPDGARYTLKAIKLAIAEY